MKIEQKPKFQPITIVLETNHDAEMLWEVLREHAANTKNVGHRNFANTICNWFSNQAQL